MKSLSKEQLDYVNGGFLNVAIGGAFGLGSYIYAHNFNVKEMSVSGVLLATGAGAATGGLSGLAIKAAGGGLAANVAWRPGFFGLNNNIQRTISSNK